MTTNSSGPRGLYGKIPAKADFIHRNLPTAFVIPWDEWLRRALAVSRDKLSKEWVKTYLSSPAWRFALDPGIVGPSGWLGVLVSSIDEVQRCYPLTLAVSLPPKMTLGQLGGDVDPGLEHLETIALSVIGGECTIDDVLGELASVPFDFQADAEHAHTIHHWRGGGAVANFNMPSPRSVAGMISEVIPGGPAAGLSCWWHRGWGSHRAASVIAFGLPPADGFPAFLNGRWGAHGWSEP